MIIDDVELIVHAGKGGDGKISFRREKFVPKGGPDGGNGGDGGHVFFECVSDLTALKKFRYKKEVKAPNGENGRSKKQHGKKAKHATFKVPIGTKVTNKNTGKSFELSEIGQTERIARGGRGGRGNWEFRSNENKTPRIAEEGKPGETKELHLSMQFIADVGLIGLPSAGKSSLLNVLTPAEAKVGEYPFTTLEPNLGTVGNIIIADIPGLIEGAHEGKGLGIKFLKHIEKTSLLVHCVDCTSEDVLGDYHTIKNELEEFNSALIEEKEIIVLTKTDLADEKKLKSQKEKLQNLDREIFMTSIIDDKSIKILKKRLLQSKA